MIVLSMGSVPSDERLGMGTLPQGMTNERPSITDTMPSMSLHEIQSTSKHGVHFSVSSCHSDQHIHMNMFHGWIAELSGTALHICFRCGSA